MSETDGNRPDIFFYEAFEEEAAAIEACLSASIRAGFTPATIQEYGSESPPARIISLRTQSIIPDAWAAGIDALLSRSTGFDHLTAYSRRHPGGPACGYLPLYCARAVAEQAMLLWTALSRRLPTQIKQFDSFERDGITGREIAGQTLLVVGVGNIGTEVVKIGIGLEMSVRGVDPVRRHDCVEYSDFNDAIGSADVIVCAMSLEEGNHGFFNYQNLSKCKPGAVFVNVARGELSPTSDLLRLLEDGRLGGVGLDVYENESELAVALRSGGGGGRHLGESSLAALELRKRPDVICTPHNAFNTAESVRRKSEQSVQQAAAFLKTGKFIWEIPCG